MLHRVCFDFIGLGGLMLWCLTSLSTIFQLCRGGQFYWCQGETAVPGEYHRPAASHWQNFITWRYIEYTSKWTGFEITTLVVIGTYCISSFKSNYHMTTTTTVPLILYLYWLYTNYACLFICLKQNVPIYISVDSMRM